MLPPRNHSRLALRRAMRLVGQLARRRTLLGLGITPAELAEALRSGYLWRPRRGWYATRHVDSDQLRAVATGARIGCVSALRRWGVWSGPDDMLHLHAAPTASRLGAASVSVTPTNTAPLPHPTILDAYGHELDTVRSCSPAPAITHWSEQRFPGALDWIVSVEDALLQAARCQDSEHAVACIDSALNRGAIDEDAWSRILQHLPDRLKPLDLQKDARAGSGNETIARLRIIAAGFKVEPQHSMPGIGDVDMLVDGCVVVEVDSERYHSSDTQRRKDRTRTLISLLYGIPVVRIGPEHLPPTDWPLALAALRQQVADARMLMAARRAIVRG
ncbi:hypothetical protein FB562_1871 [Homoserinimonas aerilata]|uniref:Very-short-patch-repair endonuclease n=1 Tax=Homoserinimonas aerilata TaxID=1162970 RepID=A0A542YL02_9MICO|nr:hypothetical protein [Homoserinimonas aerilata]TQL48767.1 hypothetical protein FB562_1871 [Homoserinimonas aerilata]